MDGSESTTAHTPAPATAACQLDDESLATLRLSMLPGLGPRTLTALTDQFGHASAVLGASESQLATVSGVGPKLIHTLRTATHFVDTDAILQWCRDHGCQVVVKGSPSYPQAVEDLYDAPPILFAKGQFTIADGIAVAIVGTRHATAYGTRQADRLAFGLAKAGVTIVSGLARGIDAAAHNGALSAGGRTIAVLGGGLGQIYPAEHTELAAAVAADGAVISEYAPHAKPRGGMFPQRNRIIAALSLATLVIEAPDRSGSLITARQAGELGREVLALPGPVTSRASRGTNQLIREGATLVQTVDDVLEALGPMSRSVTTDDGHEVRNPAELKLNEVERMVLAAIEPTATLIDAVIRSSGLPAHQVMATISVLEMRRLIRRLSGQYVSRI
ncbi:DNA-processing protein DprA [Stieleria sp. TO1_6]|uniref:DNA-processing protein DprA n=1 Tax=Stieleria tagensis TaxID=2956795 RepID=UPI00209B7E7A|nr:DNA-processing protein DprA [Stieleria tagensis]MCO8125040.1 DNA-processing protein DprA [Stieleria tagensis]